MSNIPTMQSSSGSFFQVWVNALTKPREETYAGIAASPSAKAMTGYIWIFLTSIVTSIVTLAVQGTTFRQQLENSGIGVDQLGGNLGGTVVGLLCFAPIGAVVGTLVYAIWVAIIQWIAKMFGGRGNNDQLAYTMAAIMAPYSLVSAVFVLLSAIPYVGFCFGAVLGLAGLYVLVLEIMAVKSVNQFGWGPAIGSYIIPGLAIFLVCCVVVALGLTLVGASLGGVFSTINQSLIQ